MNRRRLYGFVTILILTVGSWLLSYPDYIGICPPYGVDGQYACVDRLITWIEPASFLFTSLALAFFVAMFVKEEVFKAWKWLSFIYLPLAVLLIAITPGVAPNIVSFDRELTTWFASAGFLIVSLLLIVYKSWRARKISTGPTK